MRDRGDFEGMSNINHLFFPNTVQRYKKYLEYANFGVLKCKKNAFSIAKKNFLIRILQINLHISQKSSTFAADLTFRIDKMLFILTF